MKLTEILSNTNPFLRIILIIFLTVAAHFTVKTVRRFSQYLLIAKREDNKTLSETILGRKYPKVTTIITL